MQRKTQLIALTAVAGVVALALARASTKPTGGLPSASSPRAVPAGAAQASREQPEIPRRPEVQKPAPPTPASTAPVTAAATPLPPPESASAGKRWPLLMAFGAGLGLTLVWFLTPTVGAQRRSRAWRWLKRLPGRAQDGFWAFVRHEDPLPELDDAEEQRRWMPDRLLRDQIRQALGGLLPHPRDVRIRVRRGFVRLGGKVPGALKADLLRVVQDVPGVMELEDRLEPV